MLFRSGYLKPGTLSLITAPELTITVLNTPAVWTGKQGINSLVEYLDEPIIQNLAQYEIMQGAYQGLLAAGVITGNQGARYEASFVQPASRYGVNLVIAWINGQVDNATNAILTESARQAQYAIDFVGSNQSALIAVPAVPGYVNTTVRNTVEQGAVEALGEKIPAPVFASVIGNVVIPPVAPEDGVFRFAPGQPKA